MAYQTDTDLSNKYPVLGQYRDTAGAETALTAALAEANVRVKGRVKDVVTSLENDTDGLVALEQAELMYAYANLAQRPDVGVPANIREAGDREEQRAHDLLDSWVVKKRGVGVPHYEKITGSPTFTADIPESWDIDPSTDTDTS